MWRVKMFTWIPSESGQLLLIIRVVDQLKLNDELKPQLNAK